MVGIKGVDFRLAPEDAAMPASEFLGRYMAPVLASLMLAAGKAGSPFDGCEVRQDGEGNVSIEMFSMHERLDEGLAALSR